MTIHRHPDSPITVNNLPFSLPFKPAGEPRHMTAQQLQLFQIPDNVLGKTFLLSPDNDGGVYTVTSYCKGKVKYDVLFDESLLPFDFQVDAKKLTNMLEDSLYFEKE